MADGKAVFEYVKSSAQEDPSYRNITPVLEGAARAAAKAQGWIRAYLYLIIVAAKPLRGNGWVNDRSIA